MKLIGLSGKARSGKDTVANYIKTQYGFSQYAFADPLKQACSAMFGIPITDFYEDNKKEVVNDFWRISPRQMAQRLGTEGGRELFRQDIWLKRAEMEMKKLENESNGLIISDVRFDNEAEWILSMGGIVILITRKGVGGMVTEHKSESGINMAFVTDVIGNDGTLAKLYKSIDFTMGLRNIL